MAFFNITRRDGRVFEVLVDDDRLADIQAAGPWRILIPHPHDESYPKYVMRHMKCDDGVKRNQTLHRYLAGVPGYDVDHINGDGLDNRLENLRAATRSENLHNRSKPRNNTSGYKGVHFSKITGKWVASIRKMYTRSYFSFDTKEEAYEAYCKAALELHGKFAKVV